MSPTTKISTLEKVLGRLDDLDSVSLSNLVQRLARERSLLETVFNTIREGILVIDQNGIIEYANAAAGKIIGLSLKDQGQAVLWKLVPELIRTLDISSDGEYRAEFVVTRDLELNYPETRYVRLYIMPIKGVNDDDLESKHYAVIISDVTELQLSTREQIENEKISSVIMLAAGVAHELGNPLNSLTIHLQLINRQLEKLNDSNEKEKIKKQLDVCTGEWSRGAAPQRAAVRLQLAVDLPFGGTDTSAGRCQAQGDRLVGQQRRQPVQSRSVCPGEMGTPNL